MIVNNPLEELHFSVLFPFVPLADRVTFVSLDTEKGKRVVVRLHVGSRMESRHVAAMGQLFGVLPLRAGPP